MTNHKCGCNKKDCLKCKKCKTLCSPCKPKSKKIVNDFLLKFSGITPTSSEGATIFSFLADNGNGIGVDIVLNSPSYPNGFGKLSIKSLTTNVQTVVPPGATLRISLLKIGAVVPGFETLYIAGESGIKKIQLGIPTLFEEDDTFDLQLQTTGIITFPLNVSANLVANLGV